MQYQYIIVRFFLVNDCTKNYHMNTNRNLCRRYNEQFKLLHFVLIKIHVVRIPFKLDSHLQSSPYSSSVIKKTGDHITMRT